jgi:hypothetical protein
VTSGSRALSAARSRAIRRRPAAVMRTCSLLMASPSAGFLPRIAQMIKLPTSAWTSVAPLSSSAAKARSSLARSATVCRPQRTPFSLAGRHLGP